MKHTILFCLALLVISSFVKAQDAAPVPPTKAGYIIVTDTVPADGKTDVADMIQKIIDDNPNRTIYFPDGVYLLSHPIATPAKPSLSVDLRLSNYAVLKAAPGWNDPEAIVRLGGKVPFNDIRTNGSNYSLTGGIIDGSMVANGISIDSGRETKIRDVSIKHTKIGIHIKRGANSGSSDADILSVNIVGNKARDSIGVLVEGFDNTFSNMRIADVYVGLDIRSSGNSFRNLHPLYTCGWNDYGDSTGFWDRSGGNNWYSFCYSDQFAIGFHLARSIHSTFESCFCFWYAGIGPHEIGILCDESFNSMFDSFTCNFNGKSPKSIVLKEGKPGGQGLLLYPRITGPNIVEKEVYEAYLRK